MTPAELAELQLLLAAVRAELRLVLAEAAGLTARLARVAAMSHQAESLLLAMAEEAPEIRTDDTDD